MKCVETTRDGASRFAPSLLVDAAILVMDMEDVLVARMACLGAIAASCEKMEALIWRYWERCSKEVSLMGDPERILLV